MGVFGPCLPQFMCGQTFMGSLAILRQSGSRNSYGEVSIGFTSVGSIRIDLQPVTGSVSRDVHGQLARIAFIGFVAHNPDVQEFDRAYVSSALIEVVSVERFGDHAEVSWKWVR